MKYTLLELTQDILSSMDSDEINSINDTVESQQVVKVIKTVYDDIISRGDLTVNKTLFNLVASNNPDQPVLMIKPTNIDRIEWVKYDKALPSDMKSNWSDVSYLDIQDFMDFVLQYNTLESDVGAMVYVSDGFAIEFVYKTNVAPTYYTTFNDNIIMFDSYDISVDSTLQSTKTLCYGPKKTDFVEEDTYIPNLQPQQFALLLNEAKSLAWAELKQTIHTKAESTARRNWRHLQKTRHNSPDGRFSSGAHPFDKLRNFARRK